MSIWAIPRSNAEVTVKAEIISIGTEILLGEIVDTNAPYLAGQLLLLGIDLHWITQVGDNQERVVEALRRAWSRSDLIITTGGLGPTEDDLTRQSIAAMLGEEMKVDPDLERWLQGLFTRLDYEMSGRNLKQATLIPSARAIPNLRGSAPGWWIKRDNRILLALPGPTGEMQRMWEREIRDELRRTLSTAIIVSRTLKIFGLPEAKVDELVSPFLSSSNLTIGVYARPSGIELRLMAKASDQREAEEVIAPVEAQICSIIGERIWGADEETLEKVVGDLLREKGLTLAIMESCTGGRLSDLLTDVPGSSRYFKGGLVAYSNEMKVAFGVAPELITQHGAVSSPVAEAMAVVARSYLGTDIGIGITGVADTEEIEGKPIGTIHIGITDGTRTRSTHTVFPQQRQQIKLYAATRALIELRRFLRVAH